MPENLNPRTQASGITFGLPPSSLVPARTGAGPERAYPLAVSVVSILEPFAAAALLALSLPLLLGAGLAVYLLSRRSPLIAHERVGQGGRALWVLKLRTMWEGKAPSRPRRFLLVERVGGGGAAEVKSAHDPRVTSAFAAFCRQYSIDELPQLWHVVTGEMSLVGPRPLTAEELFQHYGRWANEVLRCKPGLAGLWQVKGRSRLSYRQRRRLDLFLVRNWSLRLYIRLLLATVPKVLKGSDAW